jgi:exodeoxyribonuclease VIII
MQPIEFEKWDGKAPAIVLNMPIENYHAHNSISNSGLTLVARSPAHYFFAAPWQQTRAIEIGSAFHTALLEPERFETEYMAVSVDDRRSVEYKDAAKIHGREKTLKKSEGDSIAVMLESINANEDAANLFKKEGWAEVSIFVEDPETGLVMRCRFDWLTEDGEAVDLKKTQDCREWAFSKSLYNYRYHCQAAMYSHIYKIATGSPLKSFQFLAVEEQPPCANILFDIDHFAKQYGFTEYRKAMTEYAKAFESGIWESYSGKGIVTLPDYILSSIEQEQEIK